MDLFVLFCANNSFVFPFTLTAGSDFLRTNDIESSSSYHLNLPSFEITSKLTNLPDLSDYDIDDNININLSSKYYSLQELAALDVSKNDFALFHMKIRSLSLHLEEFHALLSSLNIVFQVIGLSEIKAYVDAPIKSNIQLPGYKFHHTPSHSAAGGVGIYVKANIPANKRDDLSISTVDFETV